MTQTLSVHQFYVEINHLSKIVHRTTFANDLSDRQALVDMAPHHCRCIVTKLGCWQMEDCLHWIETYLHLTLLLLDDLDPRLRKVWRLLGTAVCHYMRAISPEDVLYPFTMAAGTNAHEALMQLGVEYEKSVSFPIANSIFPGRTLTSRPAIPQLPTPPPLSFFDTIAITRANAHYRHGRIVWAVSTWSCTCLPISLLPQCGFKQV
jgi:hypothetical protein